MSLCAQRGNSKYDYRLQVARLENEPKERDPYVGSLWRHRSYAFSWVDAWLDSRRFPPHLH